MSEIKMKILTIHSDFLEFEPKKEAMKSAEEVEKKLTRIEECLVVFSAVESGDTLATADVAVKEIEDILAQVKAKRVVIYPWVHLTNNPAPPNISLDILKKEEAALKEKGYEVWRAPFGWYKQFNIRCKGHPLSELSRDIRVGEEEKAPAKKERKEGSEFSRFILMDSDGTAYDVNRKDWKSCGIFKKDREDIRLLKQFVSNEFEGRKGGKEPKHIEYMRRMELVDYCDVSDIGNYKWYPKGVLMMDLMLDYAYFNIAKPWGAFKMKNPLLIRSDNNEVGELMGEFHERDYWVIGGKDKFLLRYASDPLGFPFLQRVNASYKQMPLKCYEEATCYRREQRGEVVGLKRVRNFLMTDMHAACADEPQARKEFETLCYRFRDLMNDVISPGNWVMGWEGTEDFFNENKDWLVEMTKKIGAPAFFKLMKEMSHYYAIKNEYQCITEDDSNIQVSTVQWDVKDGKRFHIGYVDEAGKHQDCAVILHASSFGSIERALCCILETAARQEARGEKPVLPLWLAPVQVRICPVSEKFVGDAVELADALGFRVEVDDRDMSVSKKVRDAEKHWAPYVIVFGDKEKSGQLTVRVRGSGEKMMTADELREELRQRTEGMPFRPSALPTLLSLHPHFV